MTNIAEALDEFLVVQRARLSERTFRRYDEVVWLLRDQMNNYGPNSLADDDHRRWEVAFRDDPEAYVHIFGPEKIPEQLSEFLGWYIVRKTTGSQELLTAAGTVTKKLSKWLDAEGHISGAAAAVMADQGADAALELPQANKLAELLHDSVRALPGFDPDEIGDEHWVEDMFMIERVGPGRLWFVGHGEPVRVSPAASALAREGWFVTGAIAKHDGEWRLAEIGNVYT